MKQLKERISYYETLKVEAKYAREELERTSSSAQVT